MKYLTRILGPSLVALCIVASGVAQAPDRERPNFRLELVYIFEADSTDFIFVIGNSGFRSVASLKKFIASLPPGSTIEWSPGCIRFGNEPLLSSEEEMNDFKEFCRKEEITFKLVPSG